MTDYIDQWIFNYALNHYWNYCAFRIRILWHHNFQSIKNFCFSFSSYGNISCIRAFETLTAEMLKIGCRQVHTCIWIYEVTFCLAHSTPEIICRPRINKLHSLPRRQPGQSLISKEPAGTQKQRLRCTGSTVPCTASAGRHNLTQDCLLLLGLHHTSRKRVVTKWDRN